MRCQRKNRGGAEIAEAQVHYCRIGTKKSILLHSRHLGLIFQTLIFILGSLGRKNDPFAVSNVLENMHLNHCYVRTVTKDCVSFVISSNPQSKNV